MFCPNCGTQLNDGAAFCPKCGAKVDAASSIPMQTATANSVKPVKPQKRKSTLLIGIGIILYGLCFLAFTALKPLFFVVWIIGLAEFICAIANKKAVFVLSIIQAVVLTFTLIIAFVFLRSVFVLSLLLPIAACALLLIGGRMYRKENAISGGF